MKIRPASSDDLLMILAIENLTNQIPWTEAQFLSSIEVGHYSVVIEIEEGVVGFAIYSPIIPESHLLNIAIAPYNQGQGLGREHKSNKRLHTARSSRGGQWGWDQLSPMAQHAFTMNIACPRITYLDGIEPDALELARLAPIHWGDLGIPFNREFSQKQGTVSKHFDYLVQVIPPRRSAARKMSSTNQLVL